MQDRLKPLPQLVGGGRAPPATASWGPCTAAARSSPRTASNLSGARCRAIQLIAARCSPVRRRASRWVLADAASRAPAAERPRWRRYQPTSTSPTPPTSGRPHVTIVGVDAHVWLAREKPSHRAIADRTLEGQHPWRGRHPIGAAGAPCDAAESHADRISPRTDGGPSMAIIRPCGRRVAVAAGSRERRRDPRGSRPSLALGTILGRWCPRSRQAVRTSTTRTRTPRAAGHQ